MSVLGHFYATIFFQNKYNIFSSNRQLIFMYFDVFFIFSFGTLFLYDRSYMCSLGIHDMFQSQVKKKLF